MYARSTKISKFLILIILAFSFIIINTISTFADEPVNVYINSTILDFQDARPQIINQRVMVPFRKTAESLGAQVDWNKTTETMTLTKGQSTVVHTIRSNIITVNGVAVTFDTPSTVINNRTVMPVRMIAEALNCKVEWDNSKRSVLITVEDASINSVSTDKTSVSDGEKVTITVNASKNTERVKITEANTGATLLETSTYTTLPNGSKVFSMPWTPQEGKYSVKTLKVFAGTLLSYNESPASTKTFAINISGDGKPAVVKAELSQTTIARGDEVTVTVYANALTDRIKVATNTTQNLLEIQNYTLSGTTRVFTAKVKISNRGDEKIYFYAGNASGYSPNYSTIDITVNGTGSSSSNNEKLKATVTIHDVVPSSDIIYLDEYVNLKIYTSSDIERVEVKDSEQNTINRINFTSSKNNSANEYIWSTDIKITNSGRNRFYVVAYNRNDVSTRYTVNITGESYSKNELHIINIEQKDTSAIIGDTVTFYAKTTALANYIEVRDGDYVLEKVTNSSLDSSTRTFTFKVKLTSSNVNNLRVVAYASNGTPVSKKITPKYSIASIPKIYEVEVKNNTVSKNEYIRVSVYTNADISKVWVEDPNGVRVVLSTRYDEASGNEYVWNLKFPAEDIGSRVLYTVYAQNDDKIKDEYSFRIKVTE